ncbi:hypothetical protein DFJ73DRAFT_772763 [Zopfochytrium polystomum]|nr:hypothetical protein DFJ73DRAFT_772763 [Zopfochytrium polystomum]
MNLKRVRHPHSQWNINFERLTVTLLPPVCHLLVAPAPRLDLFFRIHDPLVELTQGLYHGTSYRPVVFAHSAAQHRAALDFVDRRVRTSWGRIGPVRTAVEYFVKFEPAEIDDQDWYARHSPPSDAEDPCASAREVSWEEVEAMAVAHEARVRAAAAAAAAEGDDTEPEDFPEDLGFDEVQKVRRLASESAAEQQQHQQPPSARPLAASSGEPSVDPTDPEALYKAFTDGIKRAAMENGGDLEQVEAGLAGMKTAMMVGFVEQAAQARRDLARRALSEG